MWVGFKEWLCMLQNWGMEMWSKKSKLLDWLIFCVTVEKIVEEFHATAHAIYPVTQIPVVKNLSSALAERDHI